VDIDFTKRPVGSYFGGKHPRSVACEKCGLPGLFVGTQSRGAQRIRVFVHHATMHLNERHEPVLDYGPECWAVE
jgi:hypothetical protein